jgi:hypothetical protein
MNLNQNQSFYDKDKDLDKNKVYDKDKPVEKTYISLADQYNLTINDLIKKNYWKKSRCDMQYKEDNQIPIGHPKFNETLYVRFIKA